MFRNPSIPRLRRSLSAALFLCLTPTFAAELPVFRLDLEEPGVYALTFEDLQQVTPKLRPFESKSIALLNRGEEIPLRVEDGADGRFGPGDRLLFVGRHLTGKRSFFNEHSKFNAYLLRFDRPGARRMITNNFEANPGPETRGALLTANQHLERDRLMLRFSVRVKGPNTETWYWAKLSHLNKQPFEQVLRLGNLDLESRRPVSLRIGLHGWSSQRRRTDEMPIDHQVEVRLNGELLADGSWNGQKEHVIHIERVPRRLLVAGKNKLQVTVPKRPGQKGNTLIDVVVLNWIEVGYPHHGSILRDQVALNLDPASTWLRLSSAPGRTLRVFGAAGSLIDAEDWTRHPEGSSILHLAPKPQSEARVWAVADEAFLSPARIERDMPSDLRSKDQQADYLMISHPSLAKEVHPLAAYHRQQGLNVREVLIQDIYDEFGHGIVSPTAIRDFIAHTYHHWQAPAPRFVLLVGDASWDTKNKKADDRHYADHTFNPITGHRFVKNSSTNYKPTELGHRNLIPTAQFFGNEGQAASDNFFVAVDGDDYLPDLAIGRLPVVEPEDVKAIVDKTLHYLKKSPVGPWRRSALLITNESKISQIRSDRLAEKLYSQGFQEERVYPAAEETSNAEHQNFLREAISQGRLLVHFYGHGGRYIWRTGPPDLRKNHDLFTLDDLDQLRPTESLPVILSMTCYSAPFDHPTADSIGEKFLRMANKGAVAVFAASWRNSPSAEYSDLLFDGLLQPGTTLGEAIVGAKREMRRISLITLYNLLGDPALTLALPQHTVTLELATAHSLTEGINQVSIDGHWQAPGKNKGKGLVDWLDAEGQVLATTEVMVKKSRFQASFQATQEERQALVSARAYLWNKGKRVDGMGQLDIAPAPMDPEMQALQEAKQAAAKAKAETKKTANRN